MDTPSAHRAAEPGSVRIRFDDVLMEHIRRLLDTHPQAAALPFDLATLTSLILLVERENEIETFPDKAPERFSEIRLLQELAETGLEIDEDTRTSVKNLTHYGFVDLDPQHHLCVRKSTFDLVEVLAHMFPGMPGINLVAYTLQTMDEARSGRKDVESAIAQFDQTLAAKGVPLSRQKTVQPPAAPPIALKPGPTPNDTPNSRKTAYLERLSMIRSVAQSQRSDPAILTSNGHRVTTEVKDLFARPSRNPEVEINPVEKTVEQASIPPATAPMDSECQVPEQLLTSETYEPEIPPVDTEPDLTGAGTPECPPGRDPFGESTCREGEIPPTAVTEDATDGLVPESRSEKEDGFDTDDEKTLPKGNVVYEQTQAASADDVIEQKIETFETDLAMTCPLCGSGKVLPASTDRGKRYYHCSNENCRFISWGKPYHFACPLCRNPFLIEFSDPAGIAGLKCPKATCSYRQDSLASPLVAAPSLGSLDAQAGPTKRKKLVRKRLVRRKG